MESVFTFISKRFNVAILIIGLLVIHQPELYAQQAPFGGTAWPIPGIINAEDYDVGGQSIAYNDLTLVANTTYRTDSVDVNAGWVSGAGPFYVACSATEWLEYTVDVTTAGDYIFSASVANGGAASYRVTIDGADETVAIPAGDWGTYVDISTPQITLTAGIHVLRFEAQVESFDFDKITLTFTANVNPTASITSPADAATFTAGADITIDATAADSDGTVTKVEFYQNGNLLGEDLTSPYSYTWMGVASGMYALTAVATDNGGATGTSTVVNITVGSQGPFGGTAWAVPGTINAEDYDEGGTGTAYYDLTLGNAGAVYRTDDVDINTGWVSGAGPYYVACSAGEWLEYTVDVTTAGGYIFSASVANGGAASYRVTIDGADETVAIPAGSWSVYVDVPTPEITLTAGTHVLRFEAQVESFDFDKITLTSTANADPTVSITAPADGATFLSGDDVIIDATATDSDGTVAKVEFYQNGNLLGEDLTSPYSYTWMGVASGMYALTAVATDNGGATGTSTVVNITVGSQSPFGGTAWAVPGTIEAEDYDEGGAGVAYFDTTPGGSTGGEAHTLRADDVDADTSWVDPAVIWVSASSTEWLEYTIDVTGAGGYIISAGVATTETTASYKVYIDGDSLTQVSVPNTGDWSTINSVASAEVNLVAGTHILRFEILGGSFNFDNITLTSTANVDPTASITSPTDGATFAAGDDVIIDATATDSDGTVTKVEFYQNGNLLGEDLTSPYSYTWTGVASGMYALTAVATDNSAGSTTSTAVNITVGSQSPFGGTAWAVPGTIEAEDYDEGGAGVAYFDTTPGGSTSAEAYTHRADDVDADTSWVDSSVIWVAAAATEWLEYTVNVAATGGYIISAGVATTETTASYKVYIDGDSLTQVSVSNTGDWSTITAVSSAEVTLTAGEHILKFEILGGSFNFDNITVTSTSGNTNPTVSITSPIDAATFTTGADVIIEATAADSDGTVTKVEFYQNGNLLGEDLTSPYSYTWAGVSSGNYSLTAIATDNMGATTTSSIVTIVVSPVVLSLEDPYNQVGLNITYSRYGIKLEGNANKVSVADILILDISGKVLFQKERLDWVGTTEVSYTFDVDKIHIIRVQTSEGVSANKVIFKMY